jgi:hypothetical protein
VHGRVARLLLAQVPEERGERHAVSFAQALHEQDRREHHRHPAEGGREPLRDSAIDGQRDRDQNENTVHRSETRA